MEDAIELQWAFKDHAGGVHAALAAYQAARTEAGRRPGAAGPQTL